MYLCNNTRKKHRKSPSNVRLFNKLMKKLLLLIILTLTCCQAIAQQPYPISDLMRGVMRYEYSETLDTLQQNRLRYVQPEYKFGLHMYHQAIETAMSLNCYRPDSVRRHEILGRYGDEPKERTKPVKDIDLAQYNIADAKEYILERAKSEQVLMINESHTRAEHRLFLKKATGVTPLSINQSNYVERATTRYEKDEYIALWNEYPDTREPLAIDNLDDNHSDVYIFWPRVKYIKGRPDYLLDGGTRKFKKVKTDTPTVFKAYYADEYAKYGTKCPPVDVVVAEKAGEYFMSLPKKAKIKKNNKIL